MFSLHVPIKVFLTREFKVARDTRVRLLYLVNELMTLHLIFPNKTFATMLTDVWPLTSVNKRVACEFILAGIGFTTHNALEWPLTSVDACVNHKTLIP